MPTHNRAAGVNVSNRHKKRTLFAFFFGASAWYAAPHFPNALRDSDPRVVAKENKLVYYFSERPLRKKCRGTTCRRASSRVWGPPQLRRYKKERFCVLFWHACIGTLNTRNKKRTLLRSFLAPVEGLGPPTLRLTAECSTD